MNNYNVSDQVKINNPESPIMTIHEFTWDPEEGMVDTNSVVCLWFVNDIMHSATFDVAELRKV